MQSNRIRWIAGLCAAFAVLSGGWLLLSDLSAQPDKKVQGEQLRPKWNVGDSWLIETATQSPQPRETPGGTPDEKRPLPEPVKARWEFQVTKDDVKLGPYTCYRVEINCKDEPEQPKSVLFVEKKTMTLRQFQTQIPVQGGFKTIVESYATDKEQPSVPIVGPLSALPIDLPLFLNGEAKAGEMKFTYEANSSPVGAKAVNDIAFSIDISQKMAPVKAAEVKGLVIEDLRKGLEEKPVMEVNLEVAGRKVRQLWQPGYPWPVYSDNGTTQMRLVKFTPAKPK